MAELTFSLAYGGPALEDGSMDVATLAPALLALGELFRTANATVNSTAPPVTLEIRATERGSFEVHLILTQADLIAQFVSLFSGAQVTALANLYQLVGGLGGATIGLLALIKWLGNRGIARRTPLDAGSIRIELEDGTAITVPADVLALYGSLTIRRSAETVVAPLKSDGVDFLELRREQIVSVRIEKSDVPSFRAPAQLSAVQLPDSTMELPLQVVAVSFREGNLWRFTDGNQTYNAEIADQGFLERVVRSEEAFRSGDIFRVELRIHQEQAADGRLRAFYTIEKVIEHIPSQPHTQLRLDPDEDTQ